MGMCKKGDTRDGKLDTRETNFSSIQLMGIEPKLISGTLVLVNKASTKSEKPGVY